MKKTIVFFGFIGFCSVGFSQTIISNNSDTTTQKEVVKKAVVSTNNKHVITSKFKKPIREIEAKRPVPVRFVSPIVNHSNN